MKKLFIAASLLLASHAGLAAEQPAWNVVDFSYRSVSLHGDTLTGFGFSGSRLISDNIFILGDYMQTSEDKTIIIGGDTMSDVELNANSMSLGLGYRLPLAQHTDFFTTLSYVDTEVQTRFDANEMDEDGYDLSTGVRSAMMTNIDVGASLGYIKTDNKSDTYIEIDAKYLITQKLAVGVGYKNIDDQKITSVFGTYLF